MQCMHIGIYDNEMKTIEQMEDYASRQGYMPDFSASRLHQEISTKDSRRKASGSDPPSGEICGRIENNDLTIL